MDIRKIALLIFAVILFGKLEAQELSEKASDFLKTLSPELKSQAMFSLDDPERINMNFVPIARKGPTFHDFDDMQRKAALDLLRASLSQEGFRKMQSGGQFRLGVLHGLLDNHGPSGFSAQEAHTETL